MELWGCPMGSKRSPWSKSDQKGVQKQHSEKGSKKVTKTMFSDVLNVVEVLKIFAKINDFDVLVLDPFWVAFEAFWEPNWRPRTSKRGS